MVKTHEQSNSNAPSGNTKVLALQGAASAAAIGALLFLFSGSEPATAITDEDIQAYANQKSISYSRGIAGNYLSGRFAANNGDFESANLYLNRTLRQDPDNMELAGYAYRMNLITGDLEGAVNLAEMLYEAKDEESNPEIMLFLSEVKKGDFAAASKVLDTFEKKGFNVVLLPLLEAWIDYANGKLKEPVALDEVLKKVAEFAPFVFYQTALINDISGFEDEAVLQYEEALALSKGMPYRVVEVLGNLYARRGDHEKAKALYQRYLDENPDSVLVRADDSHFTDEQTAPERVVSDAKQGMAEIFFSTASILHNENLNEEALIYIQQVLYLNPEFAAAQLMRGTILEELNREEEALAYFRSLKPGTPYYQKAQLRQAYTLNSLGKKQEAFDLLERLAKKLPDRYQVHLTHGDILMREKQYGDAVDAYSRALDAMANTDVSDRWPIFYARGISAERSNNWDLAEKDFLKALELEPDQPDVLNYLGYSWLVQEQNVEEAKEMISKAVSARPTDAHIIDSLGWAHYLLGEYDMARNYLERAIELMPTDPTVNEHLGDVYWRLGRRNEARFQWQRAILFGAEDDQTVELNKKLAEGLPPASPISKLQRAELN